MYRLFKTARIATLALALTAGSFGVAVAQESGTGSGGTGSGGTGRDGTTGGVAAQESRADRGFDWGVLGLLGLAGLIPLFIRRNDHVNHSGHTTARSAAH